MDDPSTSKWDWNQLLDFNIDDHLQLPMEDQDINNLHASSSNSNVKKHDPRMACSNCLAAGQIPCACPVLDAQLAADQEEEEEEENKKQKSKTKMTFTSTIMNKCQVPACKADISELKGYHKRHRVCLACANASNVVIDGIHKRYCQQCAKFHVLSDFDEDKRSCRRKLERHNNRRRRKSSDPKGSVFQSADCNDKAGKGVKSTTSEAAGEELFVAGEGHNSVQGSTHAQNINRDSITPLAGETHTDEGRENGDNNTDFSSMCPTGRISFKLYDWNPAEFPRRLRHQIFQWLASMPVELEGYMRPGCTIITIFIAMPRFMWVKLNEDPVVCIYDLLSLPTNMLLRRDTFYISLNSMIFSVMKGGRSVIKIEAGEKAPKLHYVQPTCFEAGKPINFLACGSNLLQPRLRFLVSFAGKFMKNEVRVSPLHTQSEASMTNSDHQFLSICVPYTELDVFGPGFVEVENESGLSNFIPILVADEEVCSEIKIMQMKYFSRLRDSESTSTTKSFEAAINKFSELLVDVAWLLKQPFVEDMECPMMSSQLQRFSFVLNFLIEYESTVVLSKALDLVMMKMNKNGGIVEADSELQGTVNYATEVINQRLERKSNLDLLPRDQDMVRAASMQIPAAGHKSEHVALLNGDCAMSVRPYNEPPEKPFNRTFTYNAIRLFMSRPLILAVAMITTCFGIYAVIFPSSKSDNMCPNDSLVFV